MPLHPDPARPLTSREIAKMVSSLLGGLAEYCEVDEIMDALDHFTENRKVYKETFETIKGMRS